MSSGVRSVTSEQSSYHKLRLVLRGDLDLLSKLFLGVLLGMELIGDICINLVFVFISGELNGDILAEFVILLFDLTEHRVLLFKESEFFVTLLSLNSRCSSQFIFFFGGV